MGTPFQNFKVVLFFEAILFILLGLIAIAAPQIFTFGVTLLIGAIFLAAGIVQIIHLFQINESQGFWATLMSAILNLAIGALMLFFPLAGIFSLTYLLIAYFLIDGILKIYYSFNLKAYQRWGWVLFSGLLSLGLAALIYTGLPGSAVWVVGLLVGINMLFFGGSVLGLAFSLPKGNR